MVNEAHPRWRARTPCLVCGKESSLPKAKYCSMECYRDAHKRDYGKCAVCEAALIKGQQRYCSITCANKGRPKKLYSNCVVCSTPLHEGQKQCCSPKCAGIARIGKRKRAAKPCEHCGTPFWNKDIRKRFCGYSCSGMARREHELKPCLQCGKETHNYRRQFCSKACFAAWRIDQRPVRVCPTCNGAVVGRKNLRYCSPKCASQGLSDSFKDKPHPKTDDVVRMFHERKTYPVIAKELRIGRHTVYEIVKRLGLKRAPIRQVRFLYNDAQREVIQRLYPTHTPKEEVLRQVNAAGPYQAKGWSQITDIALRMKVFRPKAPSLRPRYKTHRTERPTSEGPRPIAIPLREVFRWAFDLGCDRTIEAVSRAMRRDDPTHPGFTLESSRNFATWSMRR